MISPKTSMWLNIALFALQSLTGAAWLFSILSPTNAAIAAGVLGWVTTVLNFALHAYSSSQPGPMVKP